MIDWVPTGYVHLATLVARHGADQVRSDLFAGRLKAFRWDHSLGTITGIDAALWASNDATRWLEEARTATIDPFDNAPFDDQPRTLAHSVLQIAQHALPLLLVHNRSHLRRSLHLVSDSDLLHPLRALVDKLVVDPLMNEPSRRITADLTRMERDRPD